MKPLFSAQISKTLIYGIILGVAIVLYSYILYISKLDAYAGLGWIKTILIVSAIHISVSCYRNRCCEGGYISFGKAFGTGFLTLIWGFLIIWVYTFFYFKSLNPDLLEQMKIIAIENVEKKYEGEMLNQIIVMYKNIFSPFGISFLMFIGNLIWGTIATLIIAAIMQKKQTTFE